MCGHHIRADVVVRLPRPMEKGGNSNFQFFAEPTVSPQADIVVGTLNYLCSS